MSEIIAGRGNLGLPVRVVGSPLGSQSSEQRELFPLRTVIEAEEQQLGSDAWGRVLGTDGRWYIVKGGKGGQHVRASEWIATNLAENVEILCPTPQIIQMESGELFFGSAIIEGAADKLETTDILISTTASKDSGSLVGLGTALSRIYIFDMFINNIDRHEFNYLSHNDNGTQRIYAIDFARSLCWAGDLDEVPAPGSNTVAFGRRIRARHGFDVGAALSLVDRIKRVDRSVMGAICARMPVIWDSDQTTKVLLDWWSGGGFFRKVEKLREGLENGSIL
jgi:hypothetical protein